MVRHAVCALVARSRRAARLARGPRGRGVTRPYPRTPTRGKLSLQAFARCRARAALRAGVSVLAHGATRRVRAAGALLPRRSLCAQPPRAGAARPYPRTPARGKLSLQASARCARVLRSAQVFLCWRMVRHAVLPAQFPGSRKSALLMTLPAARLTTSAGTFRRMSLPMASRPSRRRRMRFARLMRSPSRSRSRRKMCPVT